MRDKRKMKHYTRNQQQKINIKQESPDSCIVAEAWNCLSVPALTSVWGA